MQNEQNANEFENHDKGEKKLMRSSKRMLLGVCSGIGEFFGVDATLIRLLVVFFALAGVGAGIVSYLIAAIIMPKSPHYQ